MKELKLPISACSQCRWRNHGKPEKCIHRDAPEWNELHSLDEIPEWCPLDTIWLTKAPTHE